MQKWKPELLVSKTGIRSQQHPASNSRMGFVEITDAFPGDLGYAGTRILKVFHWGTPWSQPQAPDRNSPHDPTQESASSLRGIPAQFPTS